MTQVFSNTRPSILIVDDKPENLGLLKDLLESEAYDVRIAPSGRLALRSVEASPPDLILLDVKMPEPDGFEVCRLLKTQEHTQDIPVLFLTALDGVEDERRGLELGAVDYIVKPFRPELVKARVRNHLRYVHQRRLLEQLVQLDPLTEIPNRRKFDAELDKEWRRAQRYELPLSLALMDLDNFKQYNDSNGHPMGDRALQSVAMALSECAQRSRDLAARYGGDEFIVMLPGCDARTAHEVALALRKCVTDLNLSYQLDVEHGTLGLSVGGATVVPSASLRPQDLVDRADDNLYRAKRDDRLHVFWTNLDD